MQEQFMKAEIDKPNCSLFMTLREMFIANSDMCYMFACEAYKEFEKRHWCDSDDFQLRYEQLATYGVMLSGIVFAYDMSSGTMSLYTSSLGALEQLAKMGVLKGKKQPIAIELDQLKQTLYESDRIKKSIRDSSGKLVSVRLDTELKDRSLMMTMTVPRTAISLNTHMLIPFKSVVKAHEVLYKIFQTTICRVTMGDKVRDVTLNKDWLTAIYGADRAEKLISYLPDVYTQRFYVPSIGASKYTVGVTNIKITDIDRIQGITLADVNLTEVNLDLTMIKDYITDVINKMSSVELKKACEVFDIDTDSQDYATLMVDALSRNRTVSDMDDFNVSRSVLLNKIGGMYNSSIWEVMKNNRALFHTDSYSSMKNKFGDLYEYTQIPRSQDELNRLLSNGVYKIVLTKRNGTFSTNICSNNNKILCNILGENFLEYESDGVKLRLLRKALSGGTKTDDEVKSLIKRYKCENLVTGTQQAVLNNINTHLESIEMNKTVVKQPKLVLARNLEATSKESYYKYIDIKQIVEIIKLQ